MPLQSYLPPQPRADELVLPRDRTPLVAVAEVPSARPLERLVAVDPTPAATNRDQWRRVGPVEGG